MHDNNNHDNDDDDNDEAVKNATNEHNSDVSHFL